MVVDLRTSDVRTLISLVTAEIDRVAEAREWHDSVDPGFFYHLIDIRNRLMAMPLDEELPSIISDRNWQELLKGKPAE